jgi:AraC family ethanolamine operon transcriptional activator
MADPNCSLVTEIASQHGFWHVSKFSADYKYQFAELPFQTLKINL